MLPHEVPLTLTSFPRLGAPGVFTDPYYPPGGDVARSLFLPDEAINEHVRFPCVVLSLSLLQTQLSLPLLGLGEK
jgi:glutamate--cysteine ligase catalytic subunit